MIRSHCQAHKQFHPACPVCITLDRKSEDNQLKQRTTDAKPEYHDEDVKP